MCNNNINQITDVITLRFIHQLDNFMHIISLHSTGAAVTLSSSDSGLYAGGYSATSVFGWISKI